MTSQVQQKHMAFSGCEDPLQQGYEVAEIAPSFTITHTFNAPVKGYDQNNDTNDVTQWTSSDLRAYNLHRLGILGFVYAPTANHPNSIHTGILGDMTRIPRKHDVYLLRAQTDPTHNGLYIVLGVNVLGGHWTGAGQWTLLRLDPASVGAHIHSNYGGDPHYTAMKQLEGFWPGVYLTSVSAVTDDITQQPTINADGNLVFASAFMTGGAQGTPVIITDLKARLTSNRTGEHIDTHTVDRFIKLSHNTDPAVNRLWKFPANSWTVGDPMIWYPVEESDVKFVRTVNDELHVSGGKQFDLNDPDHADYSISTLFGGDVPDIVHNSPHSVVIRVTQQTDVLHNGYYRWDIDGSINPTTSRVGAVGNVGGYYTYRRFVKLPYFTYYTANQVDLSVNISSPQGKYMAMTSSPNPTDNSQYTWTEGADAPIILPPSDSPSATADHLVAADYTGVDGRVHVVRGRVADGVPDRVEYFINGTEDAHPHPLATMASEMSIGFSETLAVGDVVMKGLNGGNDHPVGVSVWVYSGIEGAGTTKRRRVFTRHPDFTGDVFNSQIKFTLTGIVVIPITGYIAAPLGYKSMLDDYPSFGPHRKNKYMKAAGIQYAPATSSGRIEGVRDIHAEEAEISSTVFYAARNCNMTHYNQLASRGLKVEIEKLFHRFSLPIGGGNRHTHRPAVNIPLEFNRTFTRMHRSSLMFDTLEIKQVMQYNFLYGDTGEPLSDEHARTVGRVYLTMNYKGYFM